MGRAETGKNVVIIGGGFSGTMLALHLLRCAPNLSIAVLDQGRTPGCGLAYGTERDCHLLNVPAGRMSAFPAEPDHFFQWAKRNCDLPVHPSSFLPRALYGRYLRSLLNDANPSENTNLEWIRDEAVSVRREKDGIVIQRKHGLRLFSQTVVLATGNFPPGNLGIPQLKENCRRYVRMAWSKEALGGLSGNDDVLLVGSGLTSVDMAISLHAEGFRGKIHILSRHGLIPQVHSQKRSSPWPRFWDGHSPRTTRGLLRLIRDQVTAASTAGNDWRVVMDALRPFVQEIWQSLPAKERRRFLRHARAFWEVHRHRVAPEIGRTFAGMIESGQVQIHAGRVANYSETDNAAEVTFRKRGSGEKTSGETQVLRVARVINCSGPETDFRKIESPLLASFFAQGLIRQDSLSLGLDADENGALIEVNGRPSRDFYVIGPACKGRLWETTAVPELRVQAADLAGHLLQTIFRHEAGVGETENPAVTGSRAMQRAVSDERQDLAEKIS